jgi:hypothetical protein
VNSLNDLVNDALERWVAVTGTNPHQSHFRFRRADERFDDWSLIRLLEELNASRDLDPTGLTTFMMLRGAALTYLEEVKITAADFIRDARAVEQKIQPLRALKEILDNARVLEAVDLFQESLRAVADFYGLEAARRGALEKLLNDPWRLAEIRRDAFRSIETLEAHQFAWGESAEPSLGANRTVFEFWNIQSLVRAMQAQRLPGITMCLVRDPSEELFSFFCIAVRNGATCTVLTDREKLAHPEAKFMTRRPDKTLVERAARHWFPYGWLGAKATADGRALYMEKCRDLVPTNLEGVELGRLGALEPEEFVWTALLFDCIRERYGRQNLRLPALSYTGDMFVEPHALVGASSELVRTGLYTPLEAPPLTPADLETPATRAQWKEESSSPYQWMVERYGNVPAETLNVVGAAQATLAATAFTAATGLERLEEAWLHGGELVRKSEPTDFERDVYGHRPVEFHGLDPLAFGRAEELEADRRWVARSNQMKAIQTRALAEFDATRAEVVEWIRAQSERCVERWVNVAAAGSLLLRGHYSTHETDWEPAPNAFARETLTQYTAQCARYAMPSVPGKRLDRGLYVDENGSVLVTSGREWGGRYFCWDSEKTRANVFTRIQPEDSVGLVGLFGLKTVEELPWQLRHWSKNHPRGGNPILDRLDPANWKLTNPWDCFDVSVSITTSARALNARRKTLGLPRRSYEISPRD